MKDKIFKALKTKYANLGLGDKALLGMAAVLALTITDEANIETGISTPEVDESLKGMQSEGDRRAGIEKDKFKKPDPNDPPPPNPDPSKKTELELAVEKALGSVLNPFKEQITTLTNELNGFKAGETTKTRLQTLTEKLKDAPETFQKSTIAGFNRMTFKDDEDFNTYLEEIGTNATEATQEVKTKELENPAFTPQWGSTDKNGVSAATQQYIDSKKEGAAKAESALGGKQI